MIVIGIDPGTVNLGVAIYDIRADVIVSVETINIRAIASRRLDVRIMDIGYPLKEVFDRYKPNVICVETPFISRFRISAIIPLARMLQQIKTMGALSSKELGYDMVFVDVSPIEAKKAIGGSIKSKKDDMSRMLKAHPMLGVVGDLKDKTEHEVDAVAVGYHHVKDLQCIIS